MPRKDPINTIGLVATVALIGVAGFLYLPEWISHEQHSSADKGEAPQATTTQTLQPPVPAPPPSPPVPQKQAPSVIPTSEEETLQTELQRILKQVEQLEQENNQLAEEIEQTEQESRQLDAEIERIRDR